MEAADGLGGVLTRLKRLGVRLAIDDFGTGRSSLASLPHLPIDVLKVPKVFVDDLREGVPEPPLPHTILAMARALGLETVAEGIEQPWQAERLRALGCDYGQGYWFARPGSVEDLRRACAAPVPQSPPRCR